MKTVNIKISDSAKRELGNATIVGNKLHFAGQIKNYAELKKLFPTIGITWNKKDKCHYLGEDSVNQIQYILGGGQVVDEKKTRQFYGTPPDLAAKVVGLAEIKGTDKILEPSAGKGSLVKEILIYTEDIDIIEIDVSDFNYCVNTFKINKGYNQDFLNFEKDISYDKIIMNPPFTRNTWINHIEHAWNFLKSGGKLVAICPNATHNTKYQKFIESKKYKITELESGLFKDEGTNISTMILEVWK